MSIGTPQKIASQGNLASGTGTTTTADCPAGSLIVVGVFTWTTAGGTAVGTVTDSAGNLYLRATNTPAVGTVWGSALYYCSNCLHLPSGSKITVSAFSQTTYGISAAYVSGANGGLDIVNTATTTSSVTTLSCATGALSSSNEIVFGVVEPGNGGDTFGVEGNGFTSIDTIVAAVDFAYLVVSSTASVTYLPSWTGATTASAVVATFRQTAPPNTPIVVGINRTANSSTLTTTADIPPNSLVVVTLVPASGANTVSSLTDGHSNTYVQAGSGSGGSFPTFLWYSQETTNPDGTKAGTLHDIPAGTTFTATGTDPSNTLILSIAYVQGYNGGLDKTNGAQTGTGVTTFSLNTGGTLTQAAEIVFGAWHPYSGVTSYTEGSGFTNSINDISANAGLSYQIVNSTAQVTWSPTYGPATQASTFIATFMTSPLSALGSEPAPSVLPSRRRGIFGAIRSEVFIEAQLPGFSSTIIRSNQVHSGTPGPQKYYFEVTITTASTVGQVGVGIDNGLESISNQAAIGAVCWCGDGSVNYNGNLAVYNAGPFNVGDILGVAVDFVNNRIWFRDGAGNWNNSATANPATNVGGFDWSGIGNAGIFAIQQVVAASTLTPNYIGPFTNAAPVNFGPWQAFTSSGWQEIETFPVRSIASRANALIGKAQFAVPAIFTPSGWPAQDPQPPHRASERGSAALAHGDDASHLPTVTPTKNGFDQIAAQPPHRRAEKAGALAYGDDGIEAKFLFVPITVNYDFTFWPDPPRRPIEKRFAAITPRQDGSEWPIIRLVFDGWEVQPWQPPHPRPEKGAAVLPWEIDNPDVFIPPFVTPQFGYELQAWQQPPHLRVETRGTVLIIGDAGINLPFVFVPPPFVPPVGGSGDLPIGLLPDYIPRPPYKQKPNKPVRPIWDRGKIQEPEPEKPSGPPPLPPMDIFGTKAAPRIISMHGLPTFQEYVPENPMALHQRMQEALDESDALAALRAMGLIKGK